MRKEISARLVLCFAAANIVALGSGSQYFYSYYAPQLLARCGVPMEASGFLSAGLSVGTSFMGILCGWIIDQYGPQVSCMVGAVCMFLAYGSLRYCYIHMVGNQIFLFLVLILLGYGCVSSFFAAIKCCMVNFPEYRGTVVAVPFSVFALSSMIFSVTCYRFFGDDIEAVFTFLLTVCPATALLGACTLNIVPQCEAQSPEVVAKSSPDTWHSNYGSISGSLELPPTDASVAGIPEQRRLIEAGQEAAGPRIGLAKALLTVVTQYRFVGYYVVLAILHGVGQLYIYSVGYIVDIQLESNPSPSLNKEEVQSLQISIISVFSCLGRISSGPISDLLVKQFNYQRLWLILLASLFVYLAAGALITDTFSSLVFADAMPAVVKNISVASLLFGLEYGVTFGTYPVIIADAFGTDLFSTIWGVLTTGSVFTLEYFSKMLAQDIARHTSTGYEKCIKGAKCYLYTFHVVQFATVFISALILVIVVQERRRKSRSRMNGHIDNE
ncbi:ADR278Wp [Eremothecium gossypii ATCC 10895]|uniref:ADR278Wp n=1 Tax=Eremothecium gossypii (strain ATCC 10895 / CBS 109.51 / FGSC 9923 / NRRL Y-1056) TaxID=284811 RepID=Q759J9_EREGS|nr:ADR278Wp [Eremothecium gossypii ATCC 10895]AAS52198.2 ADR278Wp [Eremothecium gossypii ATCC 10895]AEY96497.1 FADR278Wp [Eremothecium gossypii FDAG1]